MHKCRVVLTLLVVFCMYASTCHGLECNLPDKMFKLNRWNNFRIEMANGDQELIIPNEFGYKNESELILLQALLNSGLRREMPIGFLYSILGHIRDLAIRGDECAAKLLMNRWNLRVDGEVAESLPEEYQIPYLERAESVRAVLAICPIRQDLISSICDWATSVGDMKRVSNLAVHLEKKGHKEFAQDLMRTCKEYSGVQ